MARWRSLEIASVVFIIGWHVSQILGQRPEIQNSYYRVIADIVSRDTANLYSSIIPVRNHTHPLDVEMSVVIGQIIQVNEYTQVLTFTLWMRLYWTNPYYEWDPSLYNGTRNVEISTDFIWRPDLIMHSDIRAEKFELGTSTVILYSNGYIKYLLPITYEASCQMHFLHYPFDQQECTFVFSSWTYDSSKFNLMHTPENYAVAQWFEKNSGWALIEFSAYIRHVLYGCCDYEFTENVFTLIIRRRFILQVCYLFIPNILINLTAASSFMLPCDSSERCTLGITIYLSMIVYLLLLQELIPASDTVPYIVRYIVCTICMVSFSQVVTIFVLRLHYNGAHDNMYQVPKFVRRYIMHGLARLLCMGDQLVSDAEHAIKMATLPREITVDHSETAGTLKHESAMDLQDIIAHEDDISLEELDEVIGGKQAVSEKLVKSMDIVDKVRDETLQPIIFVGDPHQETDVDTRISETIDTRTAPTSTSPPPAITVKDEDKPDATSPKSEPDLQAKETEIDEGRTLSPKAAAAVSPKSRSKKKLKRRSSVKGKKGANSPQSSLEAEPEAKPESPPPPAPEPEPPKPVSPSPSVPPPPVPPVPPASPAPALKTTTQSETQKQAEEKREAFKRTQRPSITIDEVTDSLDNMKKRMKSSSDKNVTTVLRPGMKLSPEPQAGKKTSRLSFAPDVKDPKRGSKVDQLTGLLKQRIFSIKPSFSEPSGFRSSSHGRRKTTQFRARKNVAAKHSSVRVIAGGRQSSVVRRDDLKEPTELLLYKMLRLSEISTVLKLEEQRKKEIMCEWQQLAMLVDRLFFAIFIIGTVALWFAYFLSIPFYDQEILI